MIHYIPDQVFNELFCEIHIVFKIIKGHFGFNHPELRQVPGSIAIFCAKGGSECIYFTKSRCAKLTLQLTTYRKICTTTKKILFEVDTAIVIAWCTPIK